MAISVYELRDEIHHMIEYEAGDGVADLEASDVAKCLADYNSNLSRSWDEISKKLSSIQKSAADDLLLYKQDLINYCEMSMEIDDLFKEYMRDTIGELETIRENLEKSQ